MKQLSRQILFLILFIPLYSASQTPQALSSSDILLGLKKLNVLGSVLYVAAHPDDENTRLLAYFSKEKLYRTGYLSLTRGDGGQNLIGNEQGVELGLIRTQELLSARRMDGAEQFFSRAYDFGFSKSTDEALRFWNHDKILSDVVWVIRKFQPDVIITRFPQDNRAGHGHHSASAVLAVEAYSAAADPSKFPEQLQYVSTWQAKRVLWNTFNFGSTNTQSETQFKQEVGMYNPVLGKSYGEIASESRSQHKSQGFGVSRQRGLATEYFSTWKGDTPVKDLFDGVNQGWSRVKGGDRLQNKIDDLIKNFSLFSPGNSVKGLVELYTDLQQLDAGYWKDQKIKEVKQLVEACSGLWVEATSTESIAVQGGSLGINFFLNNRNGNQATVKRIAVSGFDTSMNVKLESNRNFMVSRAVPVADTFPVSQPYWLKYEMQAGSFTVNDQQLIGKADVQPSFTATFLVSIEGLDIEIERPVKYKYTDPVKGEVYQPIVVVPPLLITPGKNLLLSYNKLPQTIHYSIHAFKDVDQPVASIHLPEGWKQVKSAETAEQKLIRGSETDVSFTIQPNSAETSTGRHRLEAAVNVKGKKYNSLLRSINYEHIPDVNYFKDASINIVSLDLKKVGKKIAYIEGAGDYVLTALREMNYDVQVLNDIALASEDLSQYDAIITGVRAYNIKQSLEVNYSRLMRYVEQGGNLIVQYNTSTQIGPLKAKIGPYPFGISRTRVTDENAVVTILQPSHPLLNYPNKITSEDFKGWVQERSIYHAENWDSHYQTIFSMHDPDEQASEGSLITTSYGKGNFVYTGLVFYRELPAGVPGAYRLLANLIALNKKSKP